MVLGVQHKNLLKYGILENGIEFSCDLCCMHMLYVVLGSVCLQECYC